MNPSQKLFLACGLMGAFAGIIAFALATSLLSGGTGAVFRDYYASETAVSVSPNDYLYSFRTGGQPGTLVDLRTAEEYDDGHMATAINIPAGQMDSDQITAAFSKLPKGSTPITYCYSSYCMLSRKVGKTLADNGIYAKHLTAGWLEISRDYGEYVVSGTAPGSLSFSQSANPLICDPTNGEEFGC